MNDDPIERFEETWQRARAAGIDKSEAMTLATVDADGRPSARIVLLKGVDERGFVFYTNTASRKGRAIEAEARVALVFWWDPILTQVRVEGSASPVDPSEADAYHARRPRGSQISAWASEQSEPVASRDVLVARCEELEARFADQDVPRPPHWSGYRIAPAAIEFWHHEDDRLHRRERFTRTSEGWNREILQP